MGTRILKILSTGGSSPILADFLRSEDDCAAGVKTNIMSMLHADLVIGCLARNTKFSWSVLPTLKWTNDIRRPI
jgi:hypothetical protein